MANETTCRSVENDGKITDDVIVNITSLLELTDLKAYSEYTSPNNRFDCNKLSSVEQNYQADYKTLTCVRGGQKNMFQRSRFGTARLAE